MFSDLLNTLLQFAEFLWPLHKVQQWEKGMYTVCGRFWKEVGPGVYPKLPWFCEIHSTTLAWRPVGTGRCDITTKDGHLLTFSAIAMFRVVDLWKAMVVVHDDEHAFLNMVTSVLSEKLAEVEVERFAPDKRGRLNSSLQGWVKQEAEEFGLEVRWVRFTAFIVNPKAFRLLSESAPYIA
jgi:regulator of protease activity HflC (stomatin/prohibitin superfamily)